MIWFFNTLIFFERDSEYSDLLTGTLTAKRYLRLINSTHYLSRSFIVDDKLENFSLPPNIITIGRRLTKGLRIKILRALDVYPIKSQIRVYQLFFEIKELGYRYNCKDKIWEFRVRS